MRRSTRYWIAAGCVLVCAALALIAYLVFVSIACAGLGMDTVSRARATSFGIPLKGPEQLESTVVSRRLADAKGRDE